jgi:hypothetical protein
MQNPTNSLDIFCKQASDRLHRVKPRHSREGLESSTFSPAEWPIKDWRRVAPKDTLHIFSEQANDYSTDFTFDLASSAMQNLTVLYRF